MCWSLTAGQWHTHTYKERQEAEQQMRWGERACFSLSLFSVLVLEAISLASNKGEQRPAAGAGSLQGSGVKLERLCRPP